MAVGVPVAQALLCPRCKVTRPMINIDGGTLFRCTRCEWPWTLATQAPTGTTNAVAAVGATALSVASGGASFTNGMILLVDTAVSSNAEVVTVNGAPTGTSIPVTALIKAHGSGAAFGQLLVSPQLAGFGIEGVPANPGYGF